MFLGVGGQADCEYSFLKSFVEVARLESYTRAAASQPAISTFLDTTLVFGCKGDLREIEFFLQD